MYWISHKKRDCWISFIVKRTKKSISNMKRKRQQDKKITDEIKVIYTSVRTPRILCNLNIHIFWSFYFFAPHFLSLLLSSSSLSSFVLCFVKYLNYGKMEPEIAWKYPFFRYFSLHFMFPTKCEIFCWCAEHLMLFLEFVNELALMHTFLL